MKKNKKILLTSIGLLPIVSLPLLVNISASTNTNTENTQSYVTIPNDFFNINGNNLESVKSDKISELSNFLENNEYVKFDDNITTISKNVFRVGRNNSDHSIFYNFRNVDFNNITSVGEASFEQSGTNKNFSFLTLKMPNITNIDRYAFSYGGDNNKNGKVQYNLTFIDAPKLQTLGESAFGNWQTDNQRDGETYRSTDNPLVINMPELINIGKTAFFNNYLAELNLPKLTNVFGNDGTWTKPPFLNNQIKKINLPSLELNRSNNLLKGLNNGKAFDSIILPDSTDDQKRALGLTEEQIAKANEFKQNFDRAKEAAKAAIEQMKNLTPEEKQAAKAKVDEAIDIEQINNSKNKAEELNIKKQDAIDKIYDLENLTPEQKEAAVNEVKAADEADIDTIKEKAIALDDAKDKANKAIDAMDNLTDEQKTTAKEAVKNADTVDKVTTAKNNADASNTKKQDAINTINNLENLTPEQKKAAVDKVKAANESDVDSIKEEAIALDTAKDEANKAIDKMPNLTDVEKATAKEAVKNADTVDKVTTAKEAAKSINDDKQNDMDAIDSLENLSPEAKTILKNEVKAAEGVEAANVVKEKAISLDAATKKLKDAIETAEDQNDTPNYENADEDKKTALNNALKEANKALNNALLNPNITQEQVEKLTNDLNDAVAALNGNQNVKDNAKKVIDDLPNLTDKQKQDAKDEIDKPITTPEEVAKIKKAAEDLNTKKQDAINTINNLENLTPEQKEAAVDKVKAADEADIAGIQATAEELNTKKQDAINTINNLENLTAEQKKAAVDKVKAANEDQITDIKADAQKLNDDKQTAIDAIDKLPNLTEEQKTALKDEVKATNDKTEIDAIQDKAQKLNDDKQTATDAIDRLPNLTDKQKETAKAEVIAANNNDEINVAQDKTQKLNDDKQTLIDKVNDLKHISEEQKAAEIQKIKDAETLDAAQEIEKTISDLDNSVKQLLDKIKEAQAETKTENYSDSTANKARDLDDAITAAQAALEDELVKPEIDQAKVEELKAALVKTIEALDGDEQINGTKDDAKAAIDAMYYLSDAQKEAAKAKVDDAKNKDDIQTIVDQAQKLNDDKKAQADEVAAMDQLSPELKEEFKNKIIAADSIDAATTLKNDAKDLNDATRDLKNKIAELDAVMPTNQYNYADQDKKDAFDMALAAAKKALENELLKPNVDLAKIAELKANMQKALDALNGDENFEKVKDEAKKAAAKFNYLNDQQKQTMQDEIDNTNSLPEVKAIIAQYGDINDAKEKLVNNKLSALALPYLDETLRKEFTDKVIAANTAEEAIDQNIIKDAKDLNDAYDDLIHTLEDAQNISTNIRSEAFADALAAAQALINQTPKGIDSNLEKVQQAQKMLRTAINQAQDFAFYLNKFKQDPDKALNSIPGFNDGFDKFPTQIVLGNPVTFTVSPAWVALSPHKTQFSQITFNIDNKNDDKGSVVLSNIHIKIENRDDTTISPLKPIDVLGFKSRNRIRGQKLIESAPYLSADEKAEAINDLDSAVEPLDILNITNKAVDLNDIKGIYINGKDGWKGQDYVGINNYKYLDNQLQQGFDKQVINTANESQMQEIHAEAAKLNQAYKELLELLPEGQKLLDKSYIFKEKTSPTYRILKAAIENGQKITDDNEGILNDYAKVISVKAELQKSIDGIKYQIKWWWWLILALGITGTALTIWFFIFAAKRRKRRKDEEEQRKANL